MVKIRASSFLGCLLQEQGGRQHGERVQSTKGEGKALVTDCAPLCARAMQTLSPFVLTRTLGQQA